MNPYAEQGPGVFGENAALKIPQGQTNADESIQWSIILATLPSPQLAPQVLSNVQSKHGLVDAYIAQRQKKTVIAYGKYDGPNDRQAILDLDQVREIQSDGSRPFASAFLAPPPAEALGGTNTEFDLRTVKERYGKTALYTLQLGVYGTDDSSIPKPSEVKEFRKIAERAVLKLRAEGERAFYYHGPFRSMVTAGVFGDNDFDSSTMPAIQSARLKELRLRFPHNYLNGMGIRETITTDTGRKITRLQPSSLVQIPDK
ncbi:MAG: hypothetical protein JKY43_09065 [Phycisphaerales bacterium]|nr:hypothetical protein [Phycisphaerales bacterium]